MVPIGFLLSLVGTIPRVVATVSQAVADAAEDGAITPDEGEEIGRRLSEQAGDLIQIRVRGEDVVGPDAQADLLAAIGRIAARIVRAS